jgi:hypothetical protein
VCEKNYGKHNDTTNLNLHFYESGSLHWRYRFRWAGKENNLSLGRYPDVSIEQARLDRDYYTKLLKAGFNPSEARAREKKMKSDYQNKALVVHSIDKRMDSCTKKLAQLKLSLKNIVDEIEIFEKELNNIGGKNEQ